jgi:hypothetical protein
MSKPRFGTAACVAILAIAVLVERAGVQDAATTGSLEVTRYFCSAEEDRSRIEVVGPGQTADPADLAADECDPSAGDFLLLSDFGTTVQPFGVPRSGTATLAGVTPTKGGDDRYRLVDSASTKTAYISITADTMTRVISYQYEVVIAIPTPPEIPTIFVEENPPAFPTRADDPFAILTPEPGSTTSAPSEPDPTEDPIFTQIQATMNARLVEAEGPTAATNQPRRDQPKTDRDSTLRQLAILGLITAGVVSFVLRRVERRNGTPRRKR